MLNSLLPMRSRRLPVLLLFILLFWIVWLHSIKPVIVEISAEQSIDERRAAKVKAVMEESWDAYAAQAWGMDEYYPVTMSGRLMTPKGLGWVIVDALDTLLLMNSTRRVNAARKWIENSLDYDQDHGVNVFETTIRMLGGLLSAHYLSGGDSLYLDKAIDLGDRILGAFNSTSGIPFASVNLATGQGIKSHTNNGHSSTAEVATLQLEFKYLSKLTGDMKYWNAVERVMDVLHDINPPSSLVPIFIDPEEGAYAGTEIRLGSRGDSYYEYLLKQYLQTNKEEPMYYEWYSKALDGIKEHLLDKSIPNHLVYVAELHKGVGEKKTPKMDHLVCFLPGLIALGVTGGSRYSKPDSSDDIKLAEDLTYTCNEMYNTASGLAPEIVYFNTEAGDEKDIVIMPADAHNLQRPETVESIFLLYRITGDHKYKEWGWKIFESFIEHCKVPTGGYTSIHDVTSVPVKQLNNMESFWMAETLKYLYLLYMPESFLRLEDIVFNTEAHPLPRFNKLK